MTAVLFIDIDEYFKVFKGNFKTRTGEFSKCRSKQIKNEMEMLKQNRIGS